MNLYKIGKAGVAEGGTLVLILRSVFPKEVPADGTSGRVNNIYELVQYVQCLGNSLFIFRCWTFDVHFFSVRTGQKYLSVYEVEGWRQQLDVCTKFSSFQSTRSLSRVPDFFSR